MDIRKLALALAVAAPALSGGAALAADLSPSYVAPPPPAYTWTGLYAGLNGAYGWGSSGATLVGPITGGGVSVTSLTGAVVGGTIGYNWQTNSKLVLGVEGDIDAGKIGGSSFLPLIPTAAGTTATMNLDWVATLRARIGWSTNSFGGPTLWYITGGGAWAGASRYVQNFYNPGLHTSGSYFGWTVGAGVEHAIDKHWSVKLEYLYTDLGSSNHVGGYGGGPPPPALPTSIETTRVSATASLLRFGINYKF